MTEKLVMMITGCLTELAGIGMIILGIIHSHGVLLYVGVALVILSIRPIYQYLKARNETQTN